MLAQQLDVHGVAERPDDVAAKYEIVGSAGRGAFATVYRAIQHPVERLVAVKVLDEAYVRSARHRDRFRREARVLGRIDHPGVLRLFDYGERDGQLQLVTELVTGRPLCRVLAEEAPIEPQRALRLTALLLDALAAVHDAGFVHRDIKPGNIMVEVDANGAERVRLLDFGVAAAIDNADHQAEKAGTPQYMAPEQVRDAAVDGRADLFAVGAVLYELLSGRCALMTRNVGSMLAGVPDVLVPFDRALEIRDDVEALIRSAMASDRRRRPSDAVTLRDALADIVRELDPHGEPLAFVTGGQTVPPNAFTAPRFDDIAPTADLDSINPLAATVVHVAAPVQASPSLSGPWPALDFVDDDGRSAWPADMRGSGPLPRMFDRAARASAAPAVARRPMPSALVGPRRAASVEPARPPSVCAEPPCWRRACFWTLVGVNAIVLTVSALL